MDHYGILGVKTSATSTEIKEAFRKLALQYHPDRHVKSSVDIRTASATKFKAITEAYEVLGDENKRAVYNASRSSASSYGTTSHGYHSSWAQRSHQYTNTDWTYSYRRPSTRYDNAGPFSGYTSLWERLLRSTRRSFAGAEMLAYSSVAVVTLGALAMLDLASRGVWKYKNEGKQFKPGEAAKKQQSNAAIARHQATHSRTREAESSQGAGPVGNIQANSALPPSGAPLHPAEQNPISIVRSPAASQPHTRLESDARPRLVHDNTTPVAAAAFAAATIIAATSASSQGPPSGASPSPPRPLEPDGQASAGPATAAQAGSAGSQAASLAASAALTTPSGQCSSVEAGGVATAGKPPSQNPQHLQSQHQQVDRAVLLPVASPAGMMTGHVGPGPAGMARQPHAGVPQNVPEAGSTYRR